MEIKPKGNYTAAAAKKVPHGTTAYFHKALELERQQYVTDSAYDQVLTET